MLSVSIIQAQTVKCKSFISDNDILVSYSTEVIDGLS